MRTGASEGHASSPAKETASGDAARPTSGGKCIKHRHVHRSGAGRSTPPAAQPAALPDVGDLLGDVSVEGCPGLDLELQLDPAALSAVDEDEVKAASSAFPHPASPRAAPAAPAVPRAAPASSASPPPSTTPLPSPVALAGGSGAVEGGCDSSESDYSSSSSSAARRKRNGVTPIASQTTAEGKSMRPDSDSSSSSSSYSMDSSSSQFSELFDCERPESRPAVLDSISAQAWVVPRRACAKMSAISRLRCACHFALLRSCPTKGTEAIGNDYCVEADNEN